jgi:hypothetical protein
MKVCSSAAPLAYAGAVANSMCLQTYRDLDGAFAAVINKASCRAHLQLLLLQGKRVTAVAAAKRHSLARTAEGDVWTWGHCGVSPRRVQLVGVRDVQRLSGKEVLDCLIHFDPN